MVKGIAKLVIFFTVTFVITLLSLSFLKFAEVWIDAARHIPARLISFLPEILKVLASSIPFSLYLSLLLVLSYSVRRNMKTITTMALLFFLSTGCMTAVNLGLKKMMSFPPEEPVQSVSTLGYPGLMLNQSDITIILLETPAKKDSSRVVSIPGQKLIYQAKPIGPDNTVLPLPAAPFQRELSYSLKSIMMDFSITAAYYQTLLDEGIIPFILYTAAVCLVLCSLRFLFTVSRWHLANLFLGALVFRGILTLEIFLNTDEILFYISDFVGKWLPNQFLRPLIFTIIAIMVILYTVLAYFSRGRLKKDE